MFDFYVAIFPLTQSFHGYMVDSVAGWNCLASRVHPGNPITEQARNRVKETNHGTIKELGRN